jgi:hypothetical protein
MLAIAAKIKEIIVAWAEQQSMSEMITFATDKALILFTQLFDVQVVFNPLIEKITQPT